MWAVSPHPMSELLHAYVPGLVHQGPRIGCSSGGLNRSWGGTNTPWLLLPNDGASYCCWLDQLRLLSNPPSHPTLLTQYDTLLSCFIAAILCLFCVLESFICAVQQYGIIIALHRHLLLQFVSQLWWLTLTIMAKGFYNREISFLDRVCVHQS